MKVLAALLLSLSLTAFAQTAQVVQLSPADAKEAKAIYEEQQSLIKRDAALRQRIAQTYPLVAKWTNFEFSTDFLFVVPFQINFASSVSIWPSCSSAYLTATGTTQTSDAK